MRTLIFTTALPPVNLAWTLFVVNRLCQMQSRREHLETISRRVRDVVNPLNGNIISSSHIIPYISGDSVRTLRTAELLQHEGFYLLPVRPPTVPQGTSRVRISLNAGCTDTEIDNLVQAIQNCSSKL